MSKTKELKQCEILRTRLEIQDIGNNMGKDRIYACEKERETTFFYINR